jgi:hypothetical protein
VIVTEIGRQGTQQADAGQHGQNNSPNPERREDADDHARPEEQRQSPDATIAQATPVLGTREVVKDLIGVFDLPQQWIESPRRAKLERPSILPAQPLGI